MTEIYTASSLSHKKWIGITYDWQAMVQGLTGQSCLVCLTDFELAWLQANVVYMTWQSRWTNCPCTPDELRAMGAVLERKLMTCVNIQPYQVQALYESDNEATLAEYESLYQAGGIPELNPNTPTDFYSGDGSNDRVNALCTAVSIYVKSYIQNWVAKAQIVLGLTVFLSVTAALTLVGGIIAGVVLAGLALITQTALDAMEDSDAIDDVICCMNTALQGAVISQSNFETSLDNCGFTSGSNQSIIRDIIASDLNQFGNWLSFINSVGDSLAYVQNGIIDCPCGFPLTIYVTFDYLNTIDYSLSVSVDGSGVNIIQPANLQSFVEGNPTPSAQMACITAGNGSFEGFRGIVRVELANAMDITSVDFDMWYSRVSPNEGLARSVRLYDINGVELDADSRSGTGIPQNTWTTRQFNVSADNVKFIDCRISLVDTAGPPTCINERGFIDNIIISGTLSP